MTCSASSTWGSAGASGGCGRPPKRALEIAGVVLAFVFFWPLAVAYLVWKFMGYPVPNELRSFYERNFSGAFEGLARTAPSSGGSGNLAFDDYRRSELKRLEEERRRLDEEAHAFGEFVEELKRAKDREEFDAFMTKRRGGGATAG